jgi:hypothetical protein
MKSSVLNKKIGIPVDITSNFRSVDDLLIGAMKASTDRLIKSEEKSNEKGRLTNLL